MRILVVIAGLMAGSLSAAEKPQLIALASLLTNPEHYIGQTVVTQAIVDESNASAGRLKLIEVKTGGATKKSEPAFLAATWSKSDGNPFPQNGQQAIVIGQIQMRNKEPMLQVSNIITDKEEIDFCDHSRNDLVQVIISGTMRSLPVIYPNKYELNLNVKKTTVA